MPVADADAAGASREIRRFVVEGASTPAPEVRELVLCPAEGETPLPAHAPGQWISLRLPVGDKPPLIRAYTLAAPPDDASGRLTLCFDRVAGGLGSEYLWKLGPGDAVECTGPVGNFVLPDANADDLLFVARHTGIVPFRAMLLAMDRGAVAPPSRVHLVYGAERPEELVYHAELTDLAARAPWFDYLPVVADTGAGWTGAAGTEIEVLDARARDWMPFRPFVCGVREFTFPARSFFIERLGFERRAVKVENYNGPTAAAAAG
jgi:ferredoxin-NADP reductase